MCAKNRASIIFCSLLASRENVAWPRFFVDRMQTSFSDDGRLQVEMPFHVSPKRRPSSCVATSVAPDTHCLVPIYRDAETGHRHIRLDFQLGPDFAADDVTVDVTGPTLSIVAAYGAEIGAYGTQVAPSPACKAVRTFEIPLK